MSLQHRPALLLCLLPGLLLACAVDDGRDSGLGEVGACPGGKCEGFDEDDPCSGGDVCARIEACVGWSPSADPDWKFDYFQTTTENGLYRTCLAYQTADASARPPLFDADRQHQLLRSIAANPDELWSEGQAACALLEQTRQLCRDGFSESRIVVRYDPETNEILEDVAVTRDGQCHPNADVACERYEPASTDFVDGTAASTSFAGPLERLDPHDASYCVRQTAADCTEDACGYPLVRPAAPVTWECSEEDATRLQAYVAEELGGRMMGNGSWSVGTASSNTCRMTKALVECVLPNLGQRTETNCPVINEVGDRFDGFDYCFDIQQVTGGSGAHADGRAIDLNVPSNNGNLGQCDLGCDYGPNDDSCSPDPSLDQDQAQYLCTNSERTPVLDLPPRFVSLMEGCGFTWGGRWGDPDGVVLAEGRHLGCDPMHFELPPR